jgi:hypothetical protein
MRKEPAPRIVSSLSKRTAQQASFSVDGVASAGRESRIDALEVDCLREFCALTVRRVPTVRLEDQSREIARYLLLWEERWHSWCRGESAAPVPFGLLRESGLASALVKEIADKRNHPMTNYDGRLRAAINEQRGRVETAEENLRRAESRPNGALATLCGAAWRLYSERTKHAALIRELNARRAVDPEVSGKRILPREYALGPLLSWLFRRGVPDRGIARLLQLVTLPRLSERQVKRIRSRF